jgi:ABC-type multidrug transport system permease subunit
MNITQSTMNYDQSINPLRPTLQFAVALLYANLRNLKALAITLGMPLFMLFTIWVPTMAGDEESQEIMQLLFPAIILLSVIMPGLTQTTRLTRWREQHIFQRLALTPVPLANLMVGTAFTQIMIGVGQGVLMLLFGIFLVGLEMTWLNVLLVLGAMVLAGAAFIAFGSMIAVFSSKADIAGYVFFFTIMPLTFLASFPPDMMPDSLNTITPWLPTSMAIEIIGPLFLSNQLSDGTLMAGVGLVIYTVLFASISARKFRWEA